MFCLAPSVSVSAQSGNAALTIHHRVCPVAFDGPDYYGECHDDPINGMPFTVEAQRSSRIGESVADGNVTFGDLTPGAYTIRGGPPPDRVRTAISCTLAANPGTPYPFTQRGNVEITLDLLPGQDVVCDWYVIPNNTGTSSVPVPAWTPVIVSRTLTVAGVLCPKGHGGDNVASGCAGVPAMGALYSLEVPDTWNRLPRVDFAVADSNGRVIFALDTLVPGPLRLHAIAEADAFAIGLANSFVVCTATLGNVLNVRPIVSRAAGQIFELEVKAGDDVHCEVYFLPYGP